MTSPAKMIIITSNEDIIRQFSSQKIKDTHIINLDSNKQLTLIEEDENLGYRVEISKLNFKNDRVYKRALDSPDPDQSKSVKSPRKSSDFTCTICGDHAIGFNYDVLSCAPCKIFFRRNAHQNLANIRCLTGQGQCSVAYETRRKCPRCRLERCFTVGMRKDSILSEEEIQRRKKRIEEIRNLSPTSISNCEPPSQPVPMNVDRTQTKDTSLEILSADDLIIIEKMRSSFLSIFQDHNIQCSRVDVSDRISALISYSQFVSQTALDFIQFYRQIDEFENLNVDDRFILIKYNIFSLFLISKCFYYKPNNDCCSYDDNEVAQRHRRFFMLCGDTNGIRDAFVDAILLLVKVTEQDPTLLSLLLSILIFSQCLSINEDQPPLKDSLAVNRAQNHYTKLLWNYLISTLGEVQAYKRFIQLVTGIIRLQSVGDRIREFFRVQSITSDTLDRIAPLMQTFLLIS